MMAEGSVRLVATDMDGTLLTPEGDVPPAFPTWVKAHPDIRVAIASGRQMQTLQQQFAQLRDELVFISDNGALVSCAGEVFSVTEMDAEKAQVCVRAFGEIPGAVVVLCGVTTAYVLDSASLAARASIEQYYLSLSYVPNYDNAFANDRIIKIAVYFENGPAPHDEPWKPMIPAGLKAQITSAYWVDVADESVNKGHAMRQIQERLGIAPSQCVAFGDYLNDIDLLLACGESYCMENGCDEVKAVAKHIAPSNADDGVMKVLAEL